MFLLYSMDISGIQKFIYTISSEGALRGMRAMKLLSGDYDGNIL